MPPIKVTLDDGTQHLVDIPDTNDNAAILDAIDAGRSTVIPPTTAERVGRQLPQPPIPIDALGPAAQEVTRSPAFRIPAATAISVAGGAGGAALGAAPGLIPGGAAVTPFTIPAMEAAGSYGARHLNVALGLEAPGMVGDLAAAALPPVARGVSAGVRGLVGASRAGQIERGALGAQQARDLPEQVIGPPTPADVERLYGMVRQMPFQLDTSPLSLTAKKLGAEEQWLAALGVESKGTTRLAEKLSQVPEVMDFDTLIRLQSRLGQQYRGLVRATTPGAPEKARAVAMLLTATDDVLDEAVNHSQLPQHAREALDLARQAYRHQRTAIELGAVIESGITTLDDGTSQISIGRVLDHLRKDKRFDQLRESFDATPGLREQVEASLITIGKQTGGTLRSAERWGARVGGAFAGAKVGALFGVPEVGAAAGVFLPDALGTLLLTGPGRGLVHQTLRAADVSDKALSLLAAGARAPLFSQGAPVQIPPGGVPSMEGAR